MFTFYICVNFPLQMIGSLHKLLEYLVCRRFLWQINLEYTPIRILIEGEVRYVGLVLTAQVKHILNLREFAPYISQNGSTDQCPGLSFAVSTS